MASSNMNTLLSARRPSNFLVLAPTASSNYPASPPTLSATTSKEPVSPTEELSPAGDKQAAPEVEATPKQRRSSSVSSGASGQFKFLKLGPVHFGKGEGDFTEAD